LRFIKTARTREELSESAALRIPAHYPMHLSVATEFKFPCPTIVLNSEKFGKTRERGRGSYPDELISRGITLTSAFALDVFVALCSWFTPPQTARHQPISICIVANHLKSVSLNTLEF